MAYSVMVWLVNPGVYPQQEEEQVRIVDGRESAPGTASGVNTGYSIPRIVYGVYESQDEADGALSEISRPSCSRTRPCAYRNTATGCSSSRPAGSTT